MGCSRTPPRARDFATSISVTTRESFTGRVFGMQQTSEAAGRRRPQAACEVFFPLEAGLAQVGVQIDEAREQPGPRPVEDPDSGGVRSEVLGGVAPDARDAAALDDHVDLGVERSGGVDGANVAEDDCIGHGSVGPALRRAEDGSRT